MSGPKRVLKLNFGWFGEVSGNGKTDKNENKVSPRTQKRHLFLALGMVEVDRRKWLAAVRPFLYFLGKIHV